jgi:hypothetical protein
LHCRQKAGSKPPRREILELLFLAESMGSWFFLPAIVNFRDWRSGTGKEPSGRKVLRLIQDRLSAPEFEKISTASQDNSATTNRRLGFQKSSQLFIRTHNKTLSVVAVRVSSRCWASQSSRCAFELKILHILPGSTSKELFPMGR